MAGGGAACQRARGRVGEEVRCAAALGVGVEWGGGLVEYWTGAGGGEAARRGRGRVRLSYGGGWGGGAGAQGGGWSGGAPIIYRGVTLGG